MKWTVFIQLKLSSPLKEIILFFYGTKPLAECQYLYGQVLTRISIELETACSREWRERSCFQFNLQGKRLAPIFFFFITVKMSSAGRKDHFTSFITEQQTGCQTEKNTRGLTGL